MGVASKKPYGIRAIEMTMRVDIPVSRIVDYTGPRLSSIITEEDIAGTVPTSPCFCAGSHKVETMTAADCAAVVYSRAYAWDADEEICYRYVVEGGVPQAMDSGEPLVGKQMILKAPKPSIRLGPRKKMKRAKISCPARGKRANPRVDTIRSMEERAKKKKAAKEARGKRGG